MRALLWMSGWAGLIGCGSKDDEAPSDDDGDTDVAVAPDTDADADTDSDTDADTDADTDDTDDTDVVPPALVHFTFRATGFESLEGLTLHGGATDPTVPVFLAHESAVIVGGVAELVFGQILTTGHGVVVDLYVDLDSDGVCDAPPIDEAWRVKLDPVYADTLVPFPYALGNEPRGCNSF